MGRQLSIDRIRDVINALREGKRTWSDFKEFGIPDKTLERILKDYLKEWGLVKKDGNYWVWYEYSRGFESKHDYDLAIEHSRKLLPAFRNMLEVAVVDRHPLYSYAKEHLRFYPETYRKLEKFEEAFNERVRELFQKHGSKIEGPDKRWILDPVTVKRKGFWGKLGVTETKWKRRDIPYVISWGKKELPTEGEMKEINELRDLLDDAKTFSERFEVYRKLAGDISLLIQKVEIGLEPLEGKCSLCPKIKIIEEKG